MITEFGQLAGFPPEASRFLENCFDRLLSDKEIRNDMYFAMDNFFCKDDEKYLEILDFIATKNICHKYCVNMIFFIICSAPLKYIYKQKGFSDELYQATISDLGYKLKECRDLYDIWGTFVPEWFKGFYRCKRFKLGRLQYEKIEFPFDNYKGIIQKGDFVYNCHIPSGAPLKERDVLDSLQKAYRFYYSELQGKSMPVVCRSWLLYPPHYKLFPENSNLRRFYQLFDVIDRNESKNNSNFWRIFSMEYNNDPDSWPEHTTLQKNFKKFISEGNCMGNGFGVLLFDGNKICSQTEL